MLCTEREGWGGRKVKVERSVQLVIALNIELKHNSRHEIEINAKSWGLIAKKIKERLKKRAMSLR